MRYCDGYKYQLVVDEVFQTAIKTGTTVATKYITLADTGLLVVREGYAWDGPSGPTWDTKTFMRGSLAHDALYQLMRMGLLEQKWRIPADKELVRICKVDGMWSFRRWYVERELRKFGGSSADPKNRKKILIAP